MINFPTEIREAAIAYNELGYRLSGWPRRAGKHIKGVGIKDWWTYDFPAHQVTDKINIGINHYLSDTCCIDIDHTPASIKIFKYLGLDLEDIKNSTMSWRGSERGFKSIFHEPKVKTEWFMLKNESIPSIFELRCGKHSNKEGDAQVACCDTVPPSHLYDTKVTYAFLTNPIMKKDLPNLPDKLIEVWQNQEHYTKVFLDLLA